MTERRYPLQDLADAMDCTVHALRDRLGISRASHQEWKDRGVSWPTADRLAIAAGYHPYLIWPEMLGHALAETADLPDVDETLADAQRRKDRERQARRLDRRRQARRREAA